MKLLFKNTTEYSKENYNEFIKFHKEKFGTKTLIKIALIGLGVLYIFIANLINFNFKALGAILVLGIVLYGINKLYITEQVNNRKKEIKKKKKMTFYFYENFIKIKSGRKFDRIMYFELYKIFQNDEYFFLYTDEDHSLILNKDGFEVGTPKAFDLFMKKKCPLKYKK